MRLDNIEPEAASRLERDQISKDYHSDTPSSRAAVNRENLIRQVSGNPACGDLAVHNSSFMPRQRSRLQLPGARISPRKNPATNPHRCAAMLTCGVERSNAIWIATIKPMFASRCLASGA